MKKVLILALIFCLLLTGCTGQEAQPSSSDILSSNPNNTTSNATSEGYEDVITEPEPEYFPFTCHSVDDFILWSKNGGNRGNVKVGSNGEPDNPLNQPFLTWCKNADSLILPKFKTNVFSLNYITALTAIKKSMGWRICFLNDKFLTEHPVWFMFFIFPLENAKQNEIFKKDTENTIRSYRTYIKTSAPSNKGTCKFGDYTYVNDKSESYAWLEYKNHLILIKTKGVNEAYTPWKNEYFDYFDFETVSLK